MQLKRGKSLDRLPNQEGPLNTQATCKWLRAESHALLTSELPLPAWISEYERLFRVVQAEQFSRQVAFYRDTTNRTESSEYERVVMTEWGRFQVEAVGRMVRRAQSERLPETHATWIGRIVREAGFATEASAELQPRIDELTAEYTQLRAQHRTADLMRTLDGPDRDARRDAFEVWTAGIAMTEGEVRDVMNRQVTLRLEQVSHTPYDGFEAMQYAALHRDFTPDQCAAFRDELRSRLGPDLAKRKARLGVDTLRPWDWKASTFAFPNVFSDQEGALDCAAAVLRQIDPDFALSIADLRDGGCFDLMARPDKAGGAFCSSPQPNGMPFVFASSTGAATDLLTVFHEVGHALHFLATKNQPLLAYCHANLEISEIASIAMEFLALEHMTEIVDGETAGALRAWRRQRTSSVFRNAIRVDEFQSWLYAQPEPAAADLDGAWGRISAELDPMTDWTGFEAARGRGWQVIRHLFLRPFYFIEYAFAHVVAEQILDLYRRDRADGLRVYKRLLGIGGSLTPRQTLAEVGLDWPMPELSEARRVSSHAWKNNRNPGKT